MSYLTKDDLTTHIYSELLTEIVRGNDNLVDKAISTAIAEVKSYLRKYDLAKLFSEVEDDNLKDKVKDVACWKLVKLSNPNIDMNLFKELYDDAIKWFTGIMKGQCDPDGWPYKTIAQDAVTPGTSNLISDENGNVISWSSNQKRRNHY